MRNELKNQDNWMLINVLIVLACPAVFLFGFMLGSGIGWQDLTTTENLGLWVGAVSTMVIAILTIVLAKETWHLRILQIKQAEDVRKNSIRPSLEFYLLPSIVSFQFANLHIENNGNGVARNVRFVFSGKKLQELEESEKGLVDQLLKIDYLANGLKSIGAGKDRSSYIFNFIELKNKYGDDVFNLQISVSMTYEDIEGNEYSSISVIDFSEYKGVTQLGGGNPAYNTYKEIEKIRKIIEGNQSKLPGKRLNINFYKSEEEKESD